MAETVAGVALDERSVEALEGLARGGAGVWEGAVKAAVGMVGGDAKAEAEGVGGGGDGGAVVARGSEALVALIAQTARRGLTAAAMERTLEEAGFPGATAASMSRSLWEVYPLAKEALKTEPIPIHTLRGISWRLDFTRKATEDASTSAVHQPNVIVQVQHERPHAEGGGIVTSEFSCTRQQLSVLVARVKEATEAAKKIAGPAESAKGGGKRRRG